MKRVVSIAMLLFSFSMFGAAQSATAPGAQGAAVRKSPLAEYAGSWISNFEGHAWLVFQLKLQGDALFGTVQRPHDFQFNNEGGIKTVSQEQVKEGVENAQLQGDGLLITVKDPETKQPSRYVMRLTSPNTAEVKMVAMSMPPGMPKPLPWKLSRVGATAVTPVH